MRNIVQVLYVFAGLVRCRFVVTSAQGIGRIIFREPNQSDGMTAFGDLVGVVALCGSSFAVHGFCAFLLVRMQSRVGSVAFGFTGADDEPYMNNYQVTRCESLLNNPGLSAELRMIAESLLAMASGIDDADSMAQQALERIDIVAESMRAMEKRLTALEQRAAT